MTTETTFPESCTYRAAYVGQSLLTGPEHSHLDDDALRAEAWAEALRAGVALVGTPTVDDPRINRNDIEIGDWEVE